jgi:hypothetical protein
LGRRSFIESLRGDLDKRCSVESLYRDLARRPLIESLRGGLAQRFVAESLPRRDLAKKRSCQEEILPRDHLHGDVLERSGIEISDKETLCRDLAKRPLIEIFHRDLARTPLLDVQRHCTEICCLPRGFLHILPRGLL